MPQQLCFTNQQTAAACLPSGYNTLNIGGQTNYCAIVADCNPLIECRQAQSSGGSMTCKFINDATASSSASNATSAGASSGTSTGTPVPNSASIVHCSSGSIAAIVAAVLVVGDSLRY